MLWQNVRPARSTAARMVNQRGGILWMGEHICPSGDETVGIDWGRTIDREDKDRKRWEWDKLEMSF
jgi:hypothetical protein